jgi:GT2 family glycosyltransferase
MLNHTKFMVIIVNFERAQDTIECIDSLLQAGAQASQVLVVDNGSQDKSMEHISQKHPRMKQLRLPENLGFAGGYNQGIREALKTSAEKFFILNNDTTVASDSLGYLFEADWDIAVPKILYFDEPERIWAAGARWRKFPPAVIMTGFNNSDEPKYDMPQALDYATGCALIIKREVLENLGGFDIQFTNYMEDYDYCYRVRGEGYTIGYVPQARIYHKVSRTLGSRSPLRWEQQGRNTVLFYRLEQRFPTWNLWLYLVWFTVREAAKGHRSILKSFWTGVFAGIREIRNLRSSHG